MGTLRTDHKTFNPKNILPPSYVYSDIYKMFYRELKVIYKHTKEKKYK